VILAFSLNVYGRCIFASGPTGLGRPYGFVKEAANRGGVSDKNGPIAERASSDGSSRVDGASARGGIGCRSTDRYVNRPARALFPQDAN
jgi:hypothetical protein